MVSRVSSSDFSKTPAQQDQEAGANSSRIAEVHAVAMETISAGAPSPGQSIQSTTPSILSIIREALSLVYENPFREKEGVVSGGIGYVSDLENIPGIDQELVKKPSYFNDEFFEQEALWSFPLKEGALPSQGLEAILNGPTVLDCLLASQMVLHTIIYKYIGKERYDAFLLPRHCRFLRAREEKREIPFLSDLNLVQHLPPEAELQIGDCCYFKGVPNYPWKHPGKDWGALSAIYCGVRNGERMFQGLGLPSPLPEREILQLLVDEYNKPSAIGVTFRVSSDLEWVKRRFPSFGLDRDDIFRLNFPFLKEICETSIEYLSKRSIVDRALSRVYAKPFLEGKDNVIGGIGYKDDLTIMYPFCNIDPSLLRYPSYLDPLSFEQGGSYLFSLKKGTLPHQGLDSIINGPTVVNSELASYIVLHNMILACIGKERYNAFLLHRNYRLGCHNDWGNGPEIPLLSDLNLVQHLPPDAELEIGDCCYFEGVPNYHMKHPGKHWGDLSVIYCGVRNGERMFQGLGLPSPRTEREILQLLVNEYNKPSALIGINLQVPRDPEAVKRLFPSFGFKRDRSFRLNFPFLKEISETPIENL